MSGSYDRTPVTERAAGGATMRRVMTTGGLVAFGLAYLVPMTVFTTYASVWRLTEGRVPSAYILTMAAMMFTAVSYAIHVRHRPSAGSAYAYAGSAFGDRIGAIVGWTLLLDYMLLPAINYLVVGIYLHNIIPAIPQLAIVIVAVLAVTTLNIVGINVVRTASLILVGGQIVFALVFVALAVTRTPLTADQLLKPLSLGTGSFHPIVAGAAVLCLSFLGFDAVSTLAEEARDPSRTVPRAIIITTVAGGMIFILLSWAAGLVAGAIGGPVTDAVGIQLVQPLGGRWIVGFFLAAYLGGSIASAIAAQASVARILLAMGRDGVLPHAVFGKLYWRYRTPVGALIVVAAVSLGAALLDLDTLAGMVSFGALFAFVVVNAAVVKLRLIDTGHRNGRALLLFGAVPIAGALCMAGLWTSLSPTALAVGLTWLALGITYLFLHRAATGYG